MRLIRHRRLAALAALMISTFGAHAQDTAMPTAEFCGPIYRPGAYGPYDYRTQRDKLPIVEKHHFTPQVEQLIRGQEGYLGGDLDYTLRAFPNHHRALVALMRWGDKLKSPQPPFLDLPIDCYLERAVRFKPDDTVARALFAQYLGKTKRKEAATAQLEVATQFAQDNPITHYNIGLVFFELGEFDRALRQAHTAAKLGLVRPDLEQMLRRAGKWQDAPP